jgi:VanZ family protein
LVNAIQKKIFRAGWSVHLLPAVLAVVAAFSLGTMRPSSLLVPQFDLSDKLGHLLAFGFVQITHARAAEFLWDPERSRRLVWGAAVSATLVGALLEVWQAFLPYRSAEFLDLVADALGAVLAAWIYDRARRSSYEQSVT